MTLCTDFRALQEKFDLPVSVPSSSSAIITNAFIVDTTAATTIITRADSFLRAAKF